MSPVPLAATMRSPITWGMAYGPGPTPSAHELVNFAAYFVSQIVLPDCASSAVITSSAPLR
jgi:hypothetical protein